jgi:hypothetical protein
MLGRLQARNGIDGYAWTVGSWHRHGELINAEPRHPSHRALSSSFRYMPSVDACTCLNHTSLGYDALLWVMTWTLDARDPRCGLNVTASLPLVTVPVLHVHAEAGCALVDIPCSIHHPALNTLTHGRSPPCAAGNDSVPRGTLEHWYTVSKHPESPSSRPPAPRATTAPTTRRRRSELTALHCATDGWWWCPGRGVIGDKHSTNVESPPHPPHICVSVPH